MQQDDFTPKSWRKIRIQVIYKKGDREDPGNYRPICSLPVLYKLFATVLFARLAPSLHRVQPPDQAGVRPNHRCDDCGIRMYSMTMSGTCATHVLTKAKPKAVWSRRLRCMQVSLCWWSVNCCVQACKQTQRDTQGTKRAKCAHVGDTNNTPPHAIRESSVIQTPNRARVWQIWEAREDTRKYLSSKRLCKASDSFSSSRSRCTAECANSISVPKEFRFQIDMIPAIG